MKHLKKFFESQQSNIEILKQYFYDITDDLDDICELHITENNSNYYTVRISPTLRTTGTITQDTTDAIDLWIQSNSNDSRILTELKASISRLQDENILESFSLGKYQALGGSQGYELQIFTQLKDENLEDWIFVEEDNTAWVDGLRLKKYMKDKFGVDVSGYNLGEEYDRFDQRYIELTINFEPSVAKGKMSKIESELIKKRIKDSDDNEFDIFEECFYNKHSQNCSYIGFVLHNSIIDTQ